MREKNQNLQIMLSSTFTSAFKIYLEALINGSFKKQYLKPVGACRLQLYQPNRSETIKCLKCCNFWKVIPRKFLRAFVSQAVSNKFQQPSHNTLKNPSHLSLQASQVQARVNLEEEGLSLEPRQSPSAPTVPRREAGCEEKGRETAERELKWEFLPNSQGLHFKTPEPGNNLKIQSCYQETMAPSRTQRHQTTAQMTFVATNSTKADK